MLNVLFVYNLKPDAKIEVIELNLSSLISVKRFVDKLKARHLWVLLVLKSKCTVNDLLINHGILRVLLALKIDY